MSSIVDREITSILKRLSDGEKKALDELISIAYPVLHNIAARRMKLERVNHTLQPTALVNEVYLRFFGSEPMTWQNRAHFFAVMAKHMRFILIEHARKKHGRTSNLTLALDDVGSGEPIAINSIQELIELDEVLRQLEAIDPRAARGVELRFFAGLTQVEIAEVQKIDITTVRRDWVFARSWLYSRLKPLTKN